MATQKKRGFTLIELMIVVAILGLLSAVAIAGYSKWIREAREVEAQTFLSAIKGKQAAYHAKYGNYLAAGVNPTGATLVDGESRTWDPAESTWPYLGASPGKLSTYFQYDIVSGTTACVAGNACSGITNTSSWYFVRATNSEKTFVTNSENQVIWEP